MPECRGVTVRGFRHDAPHDGHAWVTGTSTGSCGSPAGWLEAESDAHGLVSRRRGCDSLLSVERVALIVFGLAFLCVGGYALGGLCLGSALTVDIPRALAQAAPIARALHRRTSRSGPWSTSLTTSRPLRGCGHAWLLVPQRGRSDCSPAKVRGRRRSSVTETVIVSEDASLTAASETPSRPAATADLTISSCLTGTCLLGSSPFSGVL